MGYQDLSYQFGQTREQYRVLISHARDARTGQIVRLPKAALRDGEALYDAALHKNHLICPHCIAKVHYRPKKLPGGGGVLPETQEHFATSPKQKHSDNCDVSRRRVLHDHVKSEIDKTLGYQINLDILTKPGLVNIGGHFAHAHGPYIRDGLKLRYRTRSEDLRKMENYAVHGAADLVKFLRSKPMRRIQDSVVLFLNNEIQWRFFMVPYGDNGRRFKLLVSSMRDQGRRTQPVLMEMIVSERRKPNSNNVLSKKIFVNRDEEGRPSYIFPSVYLDSKDAGVQHAFDTPGRYVVLGMAKLNSQFDEVRGMRHFLSISITDPSQVVMANLKEIRAENEKRSVQDVKPAATEPFFTFAEVIKSFSPLTFRSIS